MALISMRELLRNPGRVFERLEGAAEPFLVTRRGHPVAALIPVDEAEVERLVLAAAPEFLASRDAAEHADAEGRTEPLEDLVERLAPEDGETSEEETFFHDPRLAEEVDERVTTLCQRVIPAFTAGARGRRSDAYVTTRVRVLTSGLFNRVFEEVLAESTPRLVNEAVVSKTLDPLTEEALDTASERVTAVNDELLKIGRETGDITLDKYEAAIRGIQVFERLAHVRSDVPASLPHEHSA